jgi:1,4-alpha-glucan branching enzyme
MKKSNIVFMFHAHLPWAIGHGKWPHGEDWLTEAMCESYIPLLNSFHKLIKEGISPNITIDFSPVLLEMLSNPKTPELFIAYTDLKIREAIADEKQFRDEGDRHLEYLASWWQKWYSGKRNDFINRFDQDIIRAFRELQDAGHIEIATCSATHGYAPLLGDDRSVNLQVELACRNYQKHFHRSPKGFWLAECAYRPAYTWQSQIPVEPYNKPTHRAGSEEFLSKFGIQYTFLDQYLIDNADPLGWFYNGNKDYFVDSDYHKDSGFNKSSMQPFNISSTKDTKKGTVVGLARNYDLSMRIWSANGGFPGHPDYLDFHKKRNNSMLRYWRVTDVKIDMAFKDYYRPEWTTDKLDQHSDIFLKELEEKANLYQNTSHRNAVITLPFDAELFGHWWFEGVGFLESLIRKAHSSDSLQFTKASDAIEDNKPSEVVRPLEGSWGVDSNHSVWVNDQNKWIWEYIYNSEKRISKFYSDNDLEKLNSFEQRLLLTSLKQFLLLQASDWGFLIYHDSSKNYAEHRFHSHLSDFNKLMSILESSSEKKPTKQEISYLEECEERDDIFEELNHNMWKSL